MEPLFPEENEQIDRWLAHPPQHVIDAVNNHSGDYLVLGVGGKMGTTLALMLEEAIRRSDREATVTGVSRFSRPEVRAALEAEGIKTLPCDLASPEEVASLPTPTNVFFLAGQKFGTTDAPEATWLQNTIVPGIVARHFTTSRMVVFSTGCVYPFADIDGPGCDESTPLACQGEYASSCLGRERVFTHYAKLNQTPVNLFRLNYACEVRYGVLVDIATRVRAGDSSDRSRFLVNRLRESGEVKFDSPAELSVDRVPDVVTTENRNFNQGDIFCEFADLNNDGRLDLILCSSDYSDSPPHDERLRIYLQQADGTWMTAAYREEKGNVAIFSAPTSTGPWEKSTVIETPTTETLRFGEPHIAQLPSGRVVVAIRATSIPYDDSGDHLQFWLSTSDDQGATWSEPFSSGRWGFPVHLTVLSDGRLLATYGYRRFPYGQRASISSDGEKWEELPEIIIRADAPNRDLGYPASIESAPGEILTVYYQETGNSEDTHSRPAIMSTRWTLPSR